MKNMSFWTKLNDRLQSPILAAVRDGDLEKVKALLKGSPDLVFKKDNFGWTPLHYAAHWDRRDVAEWLLSNKAEVNAKEEDGITPLHFAAEEGLKDVVELLLSSNADVNAKDNDSNTPLRL